jgi:hypothetical protein
MNLDHEVISIVVVVRLYLTIIIEAMLRIKKYHFLCISCEFKLLEKKSGLSLEVVVLKQLWIGSNHYIHNNNKKSYLNPQPFEPTNISSNQQE